MSVSVINEAMTYFVGLLNSFLTSPFGYYLCGCLVAIVCFGLLMRLLRLK